jgi:hypothetical protein
VLCVDGYARPSVGGQDMFVCIGVSGEAHVDEEGLVAGQGVEQPGPRRRQVLQEVHHHRTDSLLQGIRGGSQQVVLVIPRRGQVGLDLAGHPHHVRGPGAARSHVFEGGFGQAASLGHLDHGTKWSTAEAPESLSAQ